MEELQARAGELRKGLTALAIYAVLIGAASIALAANSLLDGETLGVSRTIIGAWGVFAGLLLWSGRTVMIDGWQAIVIWCIAQLPVYASQEDGNLFRQVFDVPMSAQSSTVVNGEMTQFSQVGINLVAVVLLVVAYRLRERWQIASRTQVESMQPA